MFALPGKGQNLAPIDISAAGKERPLQAVVTDVVASECSGATYVQGGVPHYDDRSFDVHVSGKMAFTNRSQHAVLLYKNFGPLAQRVAASPADISSGKFVTGFDGDRIAISHAPEKVSIDDFATIKPGESYNATVSTTVYASSNSQKPLHTPGKYWVQLLVDARPDEFYFAGGEKDFQRKWRSRGRVVELVITEPFPVEIRLDPNAPACTY